MQCIWQLTDCMQSLWLACSAYGSFWQHIACMQFYRVYPVYSVWAAHKNFAVLVCFNARVPPQLDEAKQDNNLSNSTTAEMKYFPLFNSDLPRPGRGKPSKVRKQMKSKIIPPANNSMITDHFRPARTNSKRRDDENIHLVPASVDCSLLSCSLRDQVPRCLWCQIWTKDLGNSG